MIWLLPLSWCLIAFGQPAWCPLFCLPAAAFGYALFWRSVSPWPSKRRFAAAALFFAAASAIQLSWMTTTEYMGPLILLVHAGVSLCLGLQFALLTRFVFQAPLTALRSAGIAGCWVLMEWIRIFACTGFTWNPVGLAWTANLFTLQGASLFGIYGLSFWAMFVNLTAFAALTRPSKRSIGVFAACAILLFAFGALRLASQRDSPRLAALLIQPSLLPHEKDFFSDRPYEMVPALEQWDRILTMIGQETGPIDLIVFPESTLPFAAKRAVYPLSFVQALWKSHFGEVPPPPDPKTARIHESTREVYVSNAYWMQALSDSLRCEVIAGLDDKDPDGKQYNAAFHFAPKRSEASRYEKRILVPIAEYIPFRGWSGFSEFIGSHYGIRDSFEAGSSAKLFEGKVPIGVSICYEETFPHIIRELKQLGAALFVNLTNDGYYPSSKLPKQHFDHGIVRAVENGAPSLRACATGVTGGVDCFGRVVASAPIDRAAALRVDVPLQNVPTLYALLGDSPILILSALLALCLVFKKKACPK